MTIYGFSGIWAYLILALLFVYGMIKGVRKSNTLFTITYSLDGLVTKDGVETMRYSQLRKKMRQSKLPFGLDDALSMLKRGGWTAGGHITQLHVGDFHRYSLAITKRGQFHTIQIEVYPQDRRATTVNFEIPPAPTLLPRAR